MPADCPWCRRELAEDDPIFCPHCGQKCADVDGGETEPLAPAFASEPEADAGLEADAGPEADAEPIDRRPSEPALIPRIPRSPRPSRILAGMMLAGAGAWALEPWPVPLASGPSPAPISATDAGAAALVLVGLLLVVGGALHRAQLDTTCRVCRRRVIGWTRPFSVRCPLEPHRARLRPGPIVLAAVLVGALAAVASPALHLVLP